MLNIAARSALIVFGLFSLWLIPVSLLGAYAGLPGYVMLIAACSLFGLHYWLAPHLLDRLLPVTWLTPDEMPPALHDFISLEYQAPGVRVGRLDSSALNCLTYGYTYHRLIVTSGLLARLEPGELQAVLAHELGHTRSGETGVMTAAAFFPLLCYWGYFKLSAAGAGWLKLRAGLRLFAALAYEAYLGFEYLLFTLSRAREFYADRYACKLIPQPQALQSALLKMAECQEPDTCLQPWLAGLRTLAIIDPQAVRDAAEFLPALPPAELTGRDRSHPQARYYGLRSSHPLLAERLRCLDRSCPESSREHSSSTSSRTARTGFAAIIDGLIQILPLAGILTGIVGFACSHKLLGLPLILGGLGFVLKHLFMYAPGPWRATTVQNLRDDGAISYRPREPVVLKGKFTAEIKPDFIWGKKLWFSDDSGSIPVIYYEALGALGWFLENSRLEHLVNVPIELKAWSFAPYYPALEFAQAKPETGAPVTAYQHLAKQVLALGSCGLGLLLLLYAL